MFLIGALSSPFMYLGIAFAYLMLYSLGVFACTEDLSEEVKTEDVFRSEVENIIPPQILDDSVTADFSLFISIKTSIAAQLKNKHINNYTFNRDKTVLNKHFKLHNKIYNHPLLNHISPNAPPLSFI